MDSSVNLLVAVLGLSEQNPSFTLPWHLEIELAVPTLPPWLLQLIPSGGDLISLSEEEFLKLDAFLGLSPRRYMVIPGSPSAAEAEDYNRALEQLIPLREYNRKLRENALTFQASSPSPTTIEEAEALGYVEAKKCVELFPYAFSSMSAFTKYLDDSERVHLIRRFKPAPNRRLVHAADLINRLFKEHDDQQNALNKLNGEKKQRRNKPGK